jgi:hypothetical protein
VGCRRSIRSDRGHRGGRSFRLARHLQDQANAQSIESDWRGRGAMPLSTSRRTEHTPGPASSRPAEIVRRIVVRRHQRVCSRRSSLVEGAYRPPVCPYRAVDDQHPASFKTWLAYTSSTSRKSVESRLSSHGATCSRSYTNSTCRPDEVRFLAPGE